MSSDDFWLAWIGIGLVLAAFFGIGCAWQVEELRPVVLGGGLLVLTSALVGYSIWRDWKADEQRRAWDRWYRDNQLRYDQAERDLIDLYKKTIGRL